MHPGNERGGRGESVGRTGSEEVRRKVTRGFPIRGPDLWIADEGAGGGREYRVREVRGGRRRSEKCDNPGNMTG